MHRRRVADPARTAETEIESPGTSLQDEKTRAQKMWKGVLQFAQPVQPAAVMIPRRKDRACLGAPQPGGQGGWLWRRADKPVNHQRGLDRGLPEIDDLDAAVDREAVENPGMFRELRSTLFRGHD